MSDYATLQQAIQSHRNVFLTGPGGVGKSYYVRALRNELGSRLSLTSTTGVSAFNLGAQTIHSFTGLGAVYQHDTVATLLKKVRKNRPAVERIRACEILVIDEISMLGRNYFEKMNDVLKIIRGSDALFGGIQLLLTGDFLQLPPINDSFCFHSDVWTGLDLVVISLTTMFRVSDPVYTKILERVRKALHTAEDNRVLFQRVIAYRDYIDSLEKKEKKEFEIEPTYLYSKKVDVHQKNMEELEHNPHASMTIRPIVIPGTVGEKEVSSEKKEEMTLILKPGAQVMLTVNLDVDAGLVNGSRGVLVDRPDSEHLQVRFLNGNVISLARHEFIVEEDGRILYKIVQFPLILAYALSIHKVQGSTLDYAVINLGYSVFEESMSYVALSRVRSLEGLFLEAFQPVRIICNKEALAFYEEL